MSNKNKKGVKTVNPTLLLKVLKYRVSYIRIYVPGVCDQAKVAYSKIGHYEWESKLKILDIFN